MPGQSQRLLKRARHMKALIIDTKGILQSLPEQIACENDGGASQS
jgi:hypothetical protein